MYVTAGFSNGELPSKQSTLDQVTPAVEASSLENVGWGALYPDLQRVFFPHFSYDDRGSALETSWLEHFYGNREQLERPLSEWNEDARTGRRPAVIFNATITDSGERMLMSTAPPAPAIGRQTLGRSIYPYQDVNIVTAADPTAGEQLTADPRVDMVTFTGSAATGRRIMAAGRTAVRCGLAGPCDG